MKKVIVFLFASALTTFASCKKEKEEMPRACYTCTQTITSTVTIIASGISTTVVQQAGVTEPCNKTQTEIDSLVNSGNSSQDTSANGTKVNISTKLTCTQK